MKKSTLRKAIVTSVLALVLCFAMLLGTTFAWFTDKASTGTNVIQSGNLKIELQVKGENGYATAEGASILPATVLWEPGYAACINAKVINKGKLAVKYTLVIEGAAAPASGADLASAIDVYYAATEIAVTGRDYEGAGLTKLGTLRQVITGGDAFAVNDMLENENDEDFATIVLVMNTEAGNEYQGLSLGEGFTIKVVATQASVEADAFGTDYDVSAEFPTD